MISYQVYKLVHFLGIFMVIGALGSPRGRATMITHGLGLFVVLLGGFGMLARLGITDGLPGWILAKLGVWTAIGALAFVLRFKPDRTRAVLWAGTALAVLAGYFALYKPF